jgi:hypothetical protein
MVPSLGAVEPLFAAAFEDFFATLVPFFAFAITGTSSKELTVTEQ